VGAKHEFHKHSTLPNLTEGEVPMSKKMPKKIGPYKIEAQLSPGGMSFLYLGLHPQKNSPVSIKVLSPRYITHPEMVSQFLKEAKIIALTDHPNIVELYGQGTWKNGLYIAMEFIQGISLKQFIIQQNLSIRSCLKIILQVSHALLHLHTHGVIHRDLKPENILITEESHVKVIDFGIAQVVGDPPPSPSLERGQFLGTPSYMSPQQRRDPLKVTCATDIYSLGVITFELITGKLSCGSIQLSLLPRNLQKIVGKALEPTLEERYSDIVDFIVDITAYLREEPFDLKSKSGGEVGEICKQLREAHRELLPPSTPKWEAFDIGVAQLNQNDDLGRYHNFFRFANRSYLICMAEHVESSIQGLVHVAILKGMLYTLIQEHFTNGSLLFRPIHFVNMLNKMLLLLDKKAYFLLQLLYLSPLQNRLSFISCGSRSILHLPAGTKTPRFLFSKNPLLGKDSHHAFYETTENWNEGDLLVVYPTSSKGVHPKDEQNFEDKLKSIVNAHLSLSAHSQAHSILNALATTPSTLVKSPPNMLLSIQRII